MLSHIKKTEEPLNEPYPDKETWNLIYENLTDGIVFIDPQGMITSANKAWLHITGYTLEEIKGTEYNKLIPPEEISSKKIKDNEMNVKLESKYIHKNGEKIPVVVNKFLKRNRENEIIEEIIIVKDESDKNKLEKSILSSAKLTAIGTLAGGVAHEFNNILSVIMTWTALARMDRSEENFQKALHTIEKNCLRGANLIYSLLDFSRIKKSSKDNIDINSLLDETLSLLKEPLKASKIKVYTSYGVLPKLNADKRQIQQVFFHILSNSKDALQDMQGKIKITTSLENEHLKIQFADNGVGIPESNLDKIFLPFFTTKGALGKSEIDGTGLGLYVAHTIVEQYDGTIEVESSVGKGTKVNICFYLKKEEEKKVVSREKKKKEIRKKKARILILEDEKFILKGLKSYISLLGHKVFASRDAISALDLLKHEKFDIAFLDIVMDGEKDGLDVYREIKNRGDDTEIVMITARSLDDELMEREKKGDFRILSKPFELEELTALIEEILEGK